MALLFYFLLCGGVVVDGNSRTRGTGFSSRAVSLGALPIDQLGGHEEGGAYTYDAGLEERRFRGVVLEGSGMT